MFHFLNRFKVDKILPVNPEELPVGYLLRNLSEWLGKWKQFPGKRYQMCDFIMDIKIGDIFRKHGSVFLVFEYQKGGFSLGLTDFL